jgi:hypothetical protein
MWPPRAPTGSPVPIASITRDRCRFRQRVQSTRFSAPLLNAESQEGEAESERRIVTTSGGYDPRPSPRRSLYRELVTSIFTWA